MDRGLRRRRRRLPLELNRIRVAEPPQHVLKDFVPPLIEGQRLAERVLHRVRWIEMRAGHAPIGHRLGRGMRPLVLQELRQNMRVRPLRAPATRRRNRLEHLDPAHPAQEHAMRTRGEDMTHRRIVTVERRTPAQERSFARRTGSDTRMQASSCTVSRPRSNSTAFWSSLQSACMSGPSSVSTERRCMTQLAAGRQSETRWLQLSRVALSEAKRRNSGCATIRMPPRGVTAETAPCPAKRHRLVGIAGEFSNRPKRAEAPMRRVIRQLSGQKRVQAGVGGHIQSKPPRKRNRMIAAAGNGKPARQSRSAPSHASAPCPAAAPVAKEACSR